MNPEFIMKQLKIIATIGKSCESDKVLTKLIRSGVDIFRINASHNTSSEIKSWCRRIRKNAKKLKNHVDIMVDLQGPRIRTGELKGAEPVMLKSGNEIKIETTPGKGDAEKIKTSFRKIVQTVRKNDRIFLDNGLMELSVTKVSKRQVLCNVITGGKLGENKGMNLPDSDLKIPILSLKDKKDLKAAISMNVEMIALSFVEEGKDLQKLREQIPKSSNVQLIAKIERPKAMENIDDICQQIDLLMVARGDMGIEVGAEKVPFIQKKLIRMAEDHGIASITATEMLESMIEKKRPTRAEVSDVANAILDGTDRVMLSAETAIGKYPVETVKMMKKIIQEAQHHMQSHSKKSH